MWCRRCCVYRRSEAFHSILFASTWSNARRAPRRTHIHTYISTMSCTIHNGDVPFLQTPENESMFHAFELPHWYLQQYSTLNVYALRCEWKQVKRITSDISCFLFGIRKCVCFGFSWNLIFFFFSVNANGWHGSNFKTVLPYQYQIPSNEFQSLSSYDVTINRHIFSTWWSFFSYSFSIWRFKMVVQVCWSETLEFNALARTSNSSAYNQNEK